MKTVLFIQEDTFQKFGSMYISGIFKKYQWKVECLIAFLENDLTRQIQEINPQVIALTCTSSEYENWARSIIKLVKKCVPDAIIMLGGPHATYMPEVIEEDGIDFVCIGEGEVPVRTFCERWDSGGRLDNIHGFWVKQDGIIIRNEDSMLINDLDTIDFPDRDLYNRYTFFYKISNIPVMTTRGCPHKCAYCYNDSFLKRFKGKGKIVRRRSVGNVIAEIKQVREKHPFTRSVQFYDDLFCCDIPQGWLQEFYLQYKREIGLPFSATAFASWINEDLVRAMKDANCISIKMGVETGNDTVRKDILKKNLKNDDIYRAAKLLHKYKIKFLTYNMLGIPTENYRDSLMTYELNRQIRPYYAWCSLLNPYQGTTITDIAIKEGCLPESYKLTSSMFEDTPLIIDRKDDTKRLQKLFAIGVFLNIPPKAIDFFTHHIRINFVYNTLFTVFYGLRISTLTGYTLMDMLILGLKTNVFKYFNFIKRVPISKSGN